MKKALIIAGVLIVVGIMIFVGALLVAGFDFTKLGTAKYEEKTYTVSEGFRNIEISVDTSDLEVKIATDGVCRVVCLEKEREGYLVKVEEDTLKISLTDERKWFDYLSFYKKNQTMTLYLPESEYGALAIKGSTGDLSIPKEFVFERVNAEVSTGDMVCACSVEGALTMKTSTGRIKICDSHLRRIDLTVSTGLVEISSVTCDEGISVNVSSGKSTLKDVRCQSFHSQGSTGDIELKNLLVAEEISLERSTGEVTFEGCDAASIFVKTSTGDVTGTLLSEKVFITKTSSGEIDTPDSITGGRCAIETSTGDIRIRVLSD